MCITLVPWENAIISRDKVRHGDSNIVSSEDVIANLLISLYKNNIVH
jgi:hypothetical protein